MSDKRIFKEATTVQEPVRPKPPAAERAPARPVEVPAKLDPRFTGDNLPPELDPIRAAQDLPPEVGGVDGPEPTRYGDWEAKGRCTDF